MNLTNKKCSFLFSVAKLFATECPNENDPEQTGFGTETESHLHVLLISLPVL